MYLVTAPCTGIALAIRYTIESGFMALGTFKVLAVVLIEYIVQTSVIIWKITVEIFYGIFHHRYNITHSLLVAKGYLPKIMYNS